MTEALGEGVQAELEYKLGNIHLPIADHRSEIEAVLRGDVVVSALQGNTGSGKSTQVMQYALELKNDDGSAYFNSVTITQPRRAATWSVAERVAHEIADAGQDYSIGHYTSITRSAKPQRLQDGAFATDGKVLAQMLHENVTPDGRRLIIFDEFHERNVNIDVLLALVTDLTDPTSEKHDPNVKVMIMSATMDTTRLQKHFKHLDIPVIKVEVPTYPVERSESVRSVASIALGLAQQTGGKVLAFLPGKREIKSVAEVAAERHSGTKSVPVVPLHSQLSIEDQRLAFDDYPGGAVIATTNVAETSLTVPDVVAVVSSGLVRISRMRYDLIASGSKALLIEDAPRASIDQQAGRTGRTGPGVHILGTLDGKMPLVPYENRPAYADPEIQRSDLGSLVLKLKATGNDIAKLRFYDKPPEQAITAAYTQLTNLGALDKNGDITDRGKRMEQLPLDPEYACMIEFAREKKYPMAVQQHLLDIAAIMQLGGIIKRAPKETNWTALLQQDAQGDVLETDSDYLAQLEVYVALQQFDPETWPGYDIIEHSASLVEQARLSLAKKLGMPLHEPGVVLPEHRQAVLTAICAGQINQLWQGSGQDWSAVLERSGKYPLAESSVVSQLGGVATGSLFTLGMLGKKPTNSIQHVNRVTDLDILNKAVPHLIVEHLDYKNIKYDEELDALVARYTRRIGKLMLEDIVRPLSTEEWEYKNNLLADGARNKAWSAWQKQKHPRTVYDTNSIDAAIADPEHAQYGTDPVTGEPFIAWKGGNGNWCETKEIAIISLEARREMLRKAPQKAELRDLKAKIKQAETDLRVLKRNKSSKHAEQIQKVEAELLQLVERRTALKTKEPEAKKPDTKVKPQDRG